MNWPIGSGKEFRGVYDRETKKVELFSDTQKGTTQGDVKKVDINDPELAWLISDSQRVQLEEEIELQDGAGAPFDQELVSGIFRLCTYKLWCGDISSAFS